MLNTKRNLRNNGILGSSASLPHNRNIVAEQNTKLPMEKAHLQLLFASNTSLSKDFIKSGKYIILFLQPAESLYVERLLSLELGRRLS